MSSGLLLQTIVPPFTDDGIWAATLSQDSQFFALSGQTVSGPYVVQVYTFPSGTLLYTFPVSYFVPTLSFSPDDTLLAIGYGPGTQGGYFTIASGAFTSASVVVQNSTQPLYGNPQFMLGGLVFTGGGTLSETASDLLTGPVTFPWYSYADYGYNSSPVFPASSTAAYITGDDGSVYALGTGCPEPGSSCDPPPQPAFTPPQSSPYATSTLSPDGNILAVATNTPANYAVTDTLQTFATGTWTPGPSITLPGNLAPAEIAFSPDSTAIAVGDPLIQILNAQNLSVKSTIAYDWDVISSVAYSPDGTFVVSGDLDGQAIVWNTVDGSLRYLLETVTPGTQAPVTSISVSPNGQLIAAANFASGSSSQGSIKIYSSSTGVLATSIPVTAGLYPYLNIGFLNNSEIVVAGTNVNPGIVVYSAITGKPLKAIDNSCSTVTGLSVFPNGKSIAVTCGDVQIVNIATGKEITLPTAGVALAVSPNSKYVAVGLNDPSDPPSVGRVQLFSAATGTLIDTFVGSNSSVWSVAFSSDSETIAAGSSNGVLNFWSISSPAAPEQTYNQETGDTSSNGPSVSAIAYSADNQHVYYGRNDASSVLIDNPVYFPIASLALSKGSAIGGTSLVGTATLTVAAPSYGAKVFLTSSNSAAAEVPASITIPNGQTSGRFAITTTAQTAPTTVTIGANSTGTVQTASLTVLPQPVLTAITLSPSSVTGGGSTTNNTVTLSSAAPSAGVRVTLASSDPDVAKPPASVVVPAGATVSPAFTITTHRVSAETNVTISATYDGITRQATLIVK